MAFALPFVALLSELGFTTAVAAAGLEVTGSVAVSELAAGVATGVAANTISDSIRETAKIVYESNVSEETRKDIQSKLNLIIGASKSVYTGNEEYLIGSLPPKKAGDNFIIPLGKNNGIPTRSIDHDLIPPYGGNAVLVDANAGQTATSYGDDFKECLDNKGNVAGGQTNSSVDYSSKDLADFLVKFSSEVAMMDIVDPQEAIINLVKTKQVSPGLAAKVSDFLASNAVPVNDEYNAIASVYNFNNVTMNNFRQRYDTKGDLIFYGVDEVKNIQSVPQNTGFSIPAIYGVWLGPQSPNNALPIDLLDAIGFFHDIDFENDGYFNTVADYKLISRMNSLLRNKRNPPGTEQLIKSSIIYFSTIGISIGSLKGSLSSDLPKMPIDSLIKDDIFPILVPSSINLNPQEYVSDRYNFYKDLGEDIQTVSTTSSMFANVGNYKTKMLSKQFRSINVQII